MVQQRPLTTSNEPLTPEALVEHLRSLRLQMPDFAQLKNSEAVFLRGAANVDEHFVHASINAIGASPVMETALGTTSETLRQEKDTVARWTAAEDELRAMLKGVAAMNLIRRHRLGLKALQVYSISQQLVRESEHSYLLPHVSEMKRLNRFGRRRKTTQPEPETPSTPTTPEVPPFVD